MTVCVCGRRFSFAYCWWKWNCVLVSFNFAWFHLSISFFSIPEIIFFVWVWTAWLYWKSRAGQLPTKWSVFVKTRANLKRTVTTTSAFCTFTVWAWNSSPFTTSMSIPNTCGWNGGLDFSSICARCLNAIKFQRGWIWKLDQEFDSILSLGFYLNK